MSYDYKIYKINAINISFFLHTGAKRNRKQNIFQNHSHLMYF